MGEEKEGKIYTKGDGNLPVLYVSGDSIPEAWENSVRELNNKGLWYHRHSRKDKGELQVDATTIIEVKNPLSNLFLHKGMNCEFETLFGYQMELFGVTDSWVDASDETDRWPYTYSERIFTFPGSKKLTNQMEATIEKMVRKPATRQLNMSIWSPERDNTSSDPPCLQRLWFGLIPNEESEDSYTLNMNYNFRSRNVMTAAPMNMTGLSFFQFYVARELMERTDKKVEVGRMVDINDSYHVSAQDQELLEKFIGRFENPEGTIEDRTFSRQMGLEIMDSYNGWGKLEKKYIDQTGKYLEGKELEEETEKILGISKNIQEMNRALVGNENA